MWNRSRRRRVRYTGTFEPELAEEFYDSFLIFKKMGLGYIYSIPDWGCGPWCCLQAPRFRKIRNKSWYSVSAWSKRKTLRTHRNPKSRK